jgi:hypothetical protein
MCIKTAVNSHAALASKKKRRCCDSAPWTNSRPPTRHRAMQLSDFFIFERGFEEEPAPKLFLDPGKMKKVFKTKSALPNCPGQSLLCLRCWSFSGVRYD